jgi:large repetitive protein
MIRPVVSALVSLLTTCPGDPDNQAPVIRDVVLTTAEDTPFVIRLEQIDVTDPDGDPVQVRLLAPQHGTLVGADNGPWIYTPAPEYSGRDEIRVQATDGENGAEGRIVFDITAVDDAPVAVADAFIGAEDTPLTVTLAQLLANDADIDSPTLEVVSVGCAIEGTVTIEGEDIVFTPAVDYVGPAEFSYVVSDGHSTSTALVTIAVEAVNDPPAPGADGLVATEDTALEVAVGDLLGNDTDADGDGLHIAAVQAAVHGAVSLVSGTITFVPAADYSGPASFEYVVSDGTANATATVAIAVAAVNDVPVAGADLIAVGEDEAASFPVAAFLGNDADADRDALSVVAVRGAVHGAVALDSGVITFTPPPDFFGVASFEYVLSDGAATSVGSVAVSVTAVNDAPVALGDAATTAEDTLLVLPAAALLGNDRDIDGDALVLVGAGNAVGGAVALVDGAVTFTPAADFHGTAGFEYAISDGAVQVSAAVAVEVTPVNDAPVAVADQAATDEDTAVAIAVAALLGNDHDVDSDALAVTAVGNPVGGTVALAGDIITFTPAPDFHGAASFDAQISDGAASSSSTVAVAVAPVNDAPVAAADSASTGEDAPLEIAAALLVGNDRDVDDDALTVTAVDSAVNGTVALAGDVITFTPAANVHGAASFDYVVSDGVASATASVSITVAPANDAPEVGADVATIPEDTILGIAASELLGNDRDADGDPLALIAVQNAVNGAVELVDSTVRFTPAPDFHGAASFEYVLSDGTAQVAAVVAITVDSVNDEPVAVADALATDEDAALDTPFAALLGNDRDVDGDALTLTAIGNAQHGWVERVGDAVRFVPSPDFHGDAEFTYVVTDGVLVASGVVTVTVASRNDAPVAAGDGISTAEDTAVEIPVALLVGNDSDIDGDTLAIAAARDAVHGAVVLAGDVVTFTPAPDFHGAAAFTYVLSDGAATATATVAITVTAVNDAPLAAADSIAAREDEAIEIDAAALLGNDSDVDGDRLTIVAVDGAQGGAVALSGTTVRFVPSPDLHGPAGFTYTVSDGSATAVAAVAIDVAAINDAPVAASDSLASDEDAILEVAGSDLLGNDSDIDRDSLAIVGVRNAIHGSVVLTGGAVSFTPDPNFHGAASFEYVISDGMLTAAALVAVIVAPINDAPFAVGDSLTTDEDVAVEVAVATLLGNDTDVDSDALSLTAVQNAVSGSVALIGGTVRFEPAADFSGPASFEYVVFDGTTSAVATVSVAISAVNDAPSAGDDAASVDEDRVLTLSAASLLANDTDVDGPALTITAVTASVGTAQLTGDGVVFTAPADFHGLATLVYTASDGELSDSATVAVTVQPTNDAPAARPDAVNTNEDAPLDIAAATLLANDGDVDGDTLTITAVRKPTRGLVMLQKGAVRFVPSANSFGDASFEYVVSDGTTTAATTVIVRVAPVNDGPRAIVDSATTAEDAAVTLPIAQLLANDIDVDGPGLTLLSVRNVYPGNVEIVGSNVVFTPLPNFNGSTGFTYRITDGEFIDVGVVNIAVTPLPDAPVAANDLLGVNEDSVLEIGESAVLANDVDVDGDTLRVTQVGNAQNGTVSLSGGVIRFTPPLNYFGPASFSYVATDGQFTTSATVTVAVAPVNDAPVAGADSGQTQEDSRSLIPFESLLANDTDIENDTLTIVGATNAVHGTVSLVGNAVAFQPDPNYVGTTASYQYVLSDGRDTSLGTVSITVRPVNDEPVANDDVFTTLINTPITIPVAALLANDTDVDGNTLMFLGAHSPSRGTIVELGDAVLFRPTLDILGPGRFQYMVFDGQAFATGVVTINIVAVLPGSADEVATEAARPACGDGRIGTPESTSVTFRWRATSCAEGGAVQLAASSATGAWSHDEPLVASCDCAPGVQSVTIKDKKLLALLDETTQLEVTSVGGAHLAWASATVEAAGGARDFTVYDAAADNAFVAGLCIAGLAPVTEASVAAPIVEQCDDGNTIAGDGCEASCTLACGAELGADRAIRDAASGLCFAGFDGVSVDLAAARALCEESGGRVPGVADLPYIEVIGRVSAPGVQPWVDAAAPAADADKARAGVVCVLP